MNSSVVVVVAIQAGILYVLHIVVNSMSTV